MLDGAGPCRIGCDIGGAFTDFVLLDEDTGLVSIEKRLTTPMDPSAGILEGLRALSRGTRGTRRGRGGWPTPQPSSPTR